MIQSTFGLERRQVEWLRRTFGHKRMSAGLRAILDAAIEEGLFDEEPWDEQDR